MKETLPSIYPPSWVTLNLITNIIFDSFLIEKNTVRIKQAESYTLHTVPRRHLFSLIAPQQPKNEITAMIAPTTMMMMDPVTYFTEDSST